MFENQNVAMFVENIHALAKLYGLKIGEVEDKAGISRGYVSRLKKAGESANIQDDTVKKIADVFGCSAKAILCHDLKNMGKDDLYYFDFVLKLYEDTCNDRIIWDRVDGDLTENTIYEEEYENHPYKYFYQLGECFDDKGERKWCYGWVSKFLFCGPLENVFVDEPDMWTYKIGKNIELLLINNGECIEAEKYDKAQGSDRAIELYLNDNGTIKPLCATYNINELSILLDKLWLYLFVRQQNRPHLTDDIREVIDDFMGKGEEDA